jgi:hypothetical protein
MFNKILFKVVPVCMPRPDAPRSKWIETNRDFQGRNLNPCTCVIVPENKSYYVQSLFQLILFPYKALQIIQSTLG